jgi:hypothetical protein
VPVVVGCLLLWGGDVGWLVVAVDCVLWVVISLTWIIFVLLFFLVLCVPGVSFLVNEFVKGMKLVTQSLFMSSQQVEKLRLSRGRSNSEAGPANNQAAQDEYYKTASMEERMSRYRAFRNRPELLTFVKNVDGDDGDDGGGGGGGGGGIEDLSARLESQIQEMEQQLGGIDRAYKQQLSTNVSDGMG